MASWGPMWNAYFLKKRMLLITSACALWGALSLAVVQSILTRLLSRYRRSARGHLVGPPPLGIYSLGGLAL
jgi:hypothetical protein